MYEYADGDLSLAPYLSHAMIAVVYATVVFERLMGDRETWQEILQSPSDISGTVIEVRGKCEGRPFVTDISKTSGGLIAKHCPRLLPPVHVIA